MKKRNKFIINIISLSLFLLPVNFLFSAPKKIFFMEFKSNDPILSKSFRTEMKQIYSGDKNYQLVDEDTIKDLNEKLKKKQMLGCDETRCLQEISNSFDAEEIITGELKIVANQYFVSLKATQRDPDSFEVGIKTAIQKSFFEKQKSYYIKEIIKSIKNPAYTIDDGSAPPVGGSATYKKKLPFREPSPVSLPTPIRFTKIAESKSEILLLYLARGDSDLESKNYESAYSNFKLALDYAEKNKLVPPVEINYRLDLSRILPLLNSFPRYGLLTERYWTPEQTENELLPSFTTYKTRLTYSPLSSEGKIIYKELEELTNSSLLLLSVELLNLLYESNELEKYVTQFNLFEKSISEIGLPKFQEVANYLQIARTNETKRKQAIDRDYLPIWNEELRRNCTTIYVSAKVFPYLQMETAERYSDTLKSLKDLSRSIKTKLTAGKGGVTPETEQVCRGVR